MLRVDEVFNLVQHRGVKGPDQVQHLADPQHILPPATAGGETR